MLDQRSVGRRLGLANTVLSVQFPHRLTGFRIWRNGFKGHNDSLRIGAFMISKRRDIVNPQALLVNIRFPAFRVWTLSTTRPQMPVEKEPQASKGLQIAQESIVLREQNGCDRSIPFGDDPDRRSRAQLVG